MISHSKFPSTLTHHLKFPPSNRLWTHREAHSTHFFSFTSSYLAPFLFIIRAKNRIQYSYHPSSSKTLFRLWHSLWIHTTLVVILCERANNYAVFYHRHFSLLAVKFDEGVPFNVQLLLTIIITIVNQMWLCRCWLCLKPMLLKWLNFCIKIHRSTLQVSQSWFSVPCVLRRRVTYCMSRVSAPWYT
jgi:hypothetical protein